MLESNFYLISGSDFFDYPTILPWVKNSAGTIWSGGNNGKTDSEDLQDRQGTGVVEGRGNEEIDRPVVFLRLIRWTSEEDVFWDSRLLG